ncbi:MAG: iron permease [Pseudonocardiales bacterium]|nr:iron permease [Pseudonocardiales bacterium]
MLPTFVIGLREGLEAALIVGMVAAFCVRSGRRDSLRWVWLGVAIAVGLCVAVGVTLELVQRNLPQREQEQLETVIALVAVVMVTYMVVWMRRNARGMSAQLEGAAGAALARGSVWALVFMAFLAVLREGFETAVFTIAAFNSAEDPVASVSGLLLGLAIACALGYGIYRGGIKLNLSKFFRATGLVLVLVAAGLVVSALHSGHEAGWVNIGQQSTVDLSWLVAGGSVRAALLTGMLGLQPHPVVIEITGWLVYLVPLGLYVAWAPKRPVPWRAVLVGSAVAAVAVAAATVGLAATAPSAPPRLSAATLSAYAGTVTTTDPVTRVSGGAVAVTGDTLAALTGPGAIVGVQLPDLQFSRDVAAGNVRIGGLDLADAGLGSVQGISVRLFTATLDRAAADPATLGALPASIPLAALQAAGGRLPLGLNPATLPDPLPLVYTDTVGVTYSVEPATGDVVDVALTLVRRAGAQAGSSLITLSTVQEAGVAGSESAVRSAAAAAADARDDLDSARTRTVTVPWVGGALTVLLVALAVVARRRACRVSGPDTDGHAQPVSADADPASSPAAQAQSTDRTQRAYARAD